MRSVFLVTMHTFVYSYVDTGLNKPYKNHKKINKILKCNVN